MDELGKVQALTLSRPHLQVSWRFVTKVQFHENINNSVVFKHTSRAAVTFTEDIAEGTF